MGRTCLITGANRGLGYAVATALAESGDEVWLLCRNRARGEEAAKALGARLLVADLGDPDSVEAAASALGTAIDHLDVLVNNAGLTTLERKVTSLGVERMWHVNALGHIQLTWALLPLLEAAEGARVVHLAGMYHRRGQLELADLDWSRRAWDWAQANADSQLARVLFSAELAARTGLCSVAVHPGAVRTGAQDIMPWGLRLLANTLLRPVFVSPAKAARTVMARLDPAELPACGHWYRRLAVADAHPLADDAEARAALWDKAAALLGRVAP